ncbi:hypothetical protein D3C72_535460 [compost metagenome]
MKGILLDENFDLMCSDGKLVMGDTTIQEVALIIGMNPGELKRDPVIGPGLTSKIRSTVRPSEIEDLLRLHLARDRKKFSDIKNLIIEKYRTQ